MNLKSHTETDVMHALYRSNAHTIDVSALDFIVGSLTAPLSCGVSLYVGVSGDITVDMLDSGTNITFKAVPVGVFPIRVSKVYHTGTSATNLVAIY